MAVERIKILVIGDLMLDKYIWGSANRLSPEAPVPVVKIEEENFSLGGACNRNGGFCIYIWRCRQ